MRLSKGMGKRWTLWVVMAAALCAGSLAWGQDPKEIVQLAVNAELAANRDDHSHWKYLQSEANGDKFCVVETQYGAVSRHVMERGQPASAATLRADDEATQRFIHDPALQAKQRHDGQHDDKSATELLHEMPEAFVWKVETDTPDSITLSYRPNQDFSPPSMESRVMGAMTGTMVVSKPGHRIQTFKGRLNSDVTIGFGLLARIKQGSTFDVERRQIAPGLWQITETHVHIVGHALFFKTIGQQQDEIKTNFTPVPPATTLEQAVKMLQEPAGNSSAAVR
jgi:hypothetical protein